MKLTQHRKDVRWLRTWVEGSDCSCDSCTMFRGVARRYLGLIRMGEDHLAYCNDWRELQHLKREKDVLKDAEGKR